MTDRRMAPSLWRVPLRPLSGLYGAAVRARNCYYDRVASAACRADVPVISVGNLTVGGTGKTPLTIEIVQRLRALGRRPAILTRGYAARRGEPADEVREFGLAVPDVPVVVNPDRVAGAALAQRQHAADCLVLDDGFQHRRLYRDLNIVIIDALNPWGGGRLLPAGRLREPLESLRRADWFIISRTNQVEPEDLAGIMATLRHYAPTTPITKAAVAVVAVIDADGQATEPATLAGRRLLPVCGVGNPQGFVGLVGKVIGQTCAPLLYPDHYRYTRRDAEAILAAARRLGAEAVVTTRKDWVKLHPCWQKAGGTGAIALYRLDVRLVPADPQGRFDARLAELFEERS